MPEYKLNQEVLQETASRKLKGVEITPETGIAVGAIPYTIKEVRGKIEMTLGFHAKTSKAPSSVKLGRTNGNKNVVRPSPFEIKRGENREGFKHNWVRSLVHTGSHYENPNEPNRIQNYQPNESIITCVNFDEQEGPRTEEAFLYEINERQMERAHSAYDDGEFIPITINENGDIFVSGIKINPHLLEKWMNSDDAKPANPDNHLIVGGKIVNLTVPAAATINIIAESFRTRAKEVITKEFSLKETIGRFIPQKLRKLMGK